MTGTLKGHMSCFEETPNDQKLKQSEQDNNDSNGYYPSITKNPY